MVSNTSCSPDEEGFVTLGSVLATYNAPINEDHAWALCHQCAQYLQSEFQPSRSDEHGGVLVKKVKSDLEFIKINTGGHVKLDVQLSTSELGEESGVGNTRWKCWSGVAQVISKVALLIYQALDYGIPEEEERSLSVELENILDKMASLEEEEEYGTESEEWKDDKVTLAFHLEDIMKTCEGRAYAGDFTSPDMFYRETCAQLVVDALEISKFIDITDQAEQALRNLNAYGDLSCNVDDILNEVTGHGQVSLSPRNDKSLEMPRVYAKQNDFKIVAKVWIQVVRELKQGVTLKKLDVKSLPALEMKQSSIRTPHDLLMDDIKLHRFHLHKVSKRKETSSR